MPDDGVADDRLEEVEEGAAGGQRDHGPAGQHDGGEDQQTRRTPSGQRAERDGAVRPAEGGDHRGPDPGGREEDVEQGDRHDAGDQQALRHPADDLAEVRPVGGPPGSQSGQAPTRSRWGRGRGSHAENSHR